MDKTRPNTKKEKSKQTANNEKPSLIITDVKSMKENLKIKEILRSVKMNSTMRLKAPRGSKIMNSKDFNDNEDFYDDGEINESQNKNLSETLSAFNPNVIVQTDDNDQKLIHESIDRVSYRNTETSTNSFLDNEDTSVVDCVANQSNTSEPHQADAESASNNSLPDKPYAPTLVHLEGTNSLKCRDRKLSLDNTMLRRGSLSQSELDLHSIGKSPLEKKSSFFRKKMDSFLKNTTEIFKRQSLGSKPQPIQRSGSMSISLQSLKDKTSQSDYLAMINNFQGSVSSLQSSSELGASTSSLYASQCLQGSNQSQQGSFAGSQASLSASQTLGDVPSDSAHSLNEAVAQDSLLNCRAISMSSGLDKAHVRLRRKSSNRSNRVTWVASEGLTNYLRRLTQDEKQEEIQVAHSYSDFASIPENDLYTPKVDSKGRRLSYQRAVSGEDPVMPVRYQDSSFRRAQRIPENSEANYELTTHLAEFAQNGVPSLKGFCIANIPDEAFAYLLWAEQSQNFEGFYDWKKLNPNEEARQAVIRELVNTEADYIRHLISIVEVFIAASHALQDRGKLLDVDTERLFSNIPDVLNASLYFWEITFYPMLADAVEKGTPFNTELMAPGFCRFRDLFQPYERYVSEQTKALAYLRSLSNKSDFMMYLSWCHSQKSCNRLQLSDILVKPMQRLTKYSLILRRIIAHTDAEPERTSLIAMESFAKNYVLDLNRSIRQREELEKLDALANSIDCYEIEFKDDDMDKFFKMYAQPNLKAPMVNCLPSHSRTIIHQGDLRFRDNVKEMDVRAILLTDMLIICKKLSKGSPYTYKMVRPKYMVDRMIQFSKLSPRNSKELSALLFVMVDEVGSAYHSFALSESAKDNNPQATLKLWEQKIKEAKMTYDLGVWFAKNPSRDLSEVEVDSFSDAISAKPSQKQSSDDLNIEREARERVAAMLHRSMGASTEYDFSQASMTTDSFDGEVSGASGAAARGLYSLRHPLQRNSTGGSSRNSRLSSFHLSTSATSHDEPQAGPSRLAYRAGSSVEHLIPPFNPDNTVTSITVNVVSESESETVVPTQQQSQPAYVSQSYNMLRVQPHGLALAMVHSLPDLTIEPSPRPSQSPSPQSASEKLYQSHQELLQRNRLAATQHHQYLNPDHRGTSYPPPSPTRASLRRGLAFSYSFKNPPLSKMGHVNSQSQLHAEAGPSSSHHMVKSDKGVLNPTLTPNPNVDKGDKKSKHVKTSKLRGGSTGSLSPGRKEDQAD